MKVGTLMLTLMLEAKLSIICLMKNCSQEDLTTKILVENLQHNFPKMETLSPSRTSSLSSPGALGTGLTPVLGAAGTTLGSGTSASGPLDLSSSSFSGNLATVKREASATEDKKFGQVLETYSSPNRKTSSTTNLGTKLRYFIISSPCQVTFVSKPYVPLAPKTSLTPTPLRKIIVDNQVRDQTYSNT